MTYLTDDLWASFAQQIVQAAVPTFDPSTQQFSLVPSATLLALDGPDPAIVNAQLYALGATVPAASPCYAPSGDLLSAYRIFLDSIDLKGAANPNLDSQINMARTQMAAAQANFQAVQTSAVYAWEAYRSINPTISFYDYVAQQYPTYIQAKYALAAATAREQQLLVQKYGAGYEVIAAARARLSASGGASDITAPNAYNMPIVASVAVAGGAMPTLSDATSGGATIPSFAPAVTQQPIAGTASAPLRLTGAGGGGDWSTLGWSAGTAGGFPQGFLSLSSGGAPFAATGPMTVAIDVTDLAGASIIPGVWFNAGIVATYCDQLVADAPDLFGATGALARLPIQAVTTPVPRITVSPAPADYASFKAGFQAQPGVTAGFGPFTVGPAPGATCSDTAVVSFDDASATITLAPPTTASALLGIVSRRLGGG